MPQLGIEFAEKSGAAFLFGGAFNAPANTFDTTYNFVLISHNFALRDAAAVSSVILKTGRQDPLSLLSYAKRYGLYRCFRSCNRNMRIGRSANATQNPSNLVGCTR